MEQSYYKPDFAIDNIVSKCNFELNNCRFRNQFNLALFRRYLNMEKKFFNRNSMLLLNINTKRSKRYPGSRLITPYYQAKYRNACLFVSYRYSGAGMKRFFIIQQDDDNHCIYSDDRTKKYYSSTNSIEDYWNHIEIQLDLSNGDARFFLEIHFNHMNKTGYFAIGDFKFGYGNCKNKIENHCYDNIINKHINVAPTAT